MSDIHVSGVPIAPAPAYSAGPWLESASRGEREKALAARMSQPVLVPRVLVAEDDPSMRRLIVSALQRDGYEVIEASDGRELFDAIEAAVLAGGRKEPPLSLIVSDVRMPGLSGLDVLQILRAGSWPIPVILATAFSDEETRRRALDLQAWAVLDKPFRLDDLRHLVRQALAARALPRDAGRR